MTAAARLPYPGLRAFRRDEADLFFGREDCVDAMLDKLAKTRFLAILGTSGSGKSSLVRTGMFEALEMGFMPGGAARWKIIDTHPGEQAFKNLAADLMAASGADANDKLGIDLLGNFLKRGPRSIVEWCEDGHLPSGWNLLILIDQFEELFRYSNYAAREEAEAFAALLLESSATVGTSIYVAITMRSEYLSACTLIPGLAEHINAGLYLTPRMRRDECRAAIEGPAGVMGFSVEPRLVNRLLNDLEDFSPWEDEKSSDQMQRLSQRADQLPLMQHVLNRLWLRAQERLPRQATVLSLEDYEQIGGLHNAIDEHGQQVTDTLSEAQKTWVESVFRALVDGSSPRLAVRRPCQFAELAALANGDREAVSAVVDAFRSPDCNFIRPPAPEAIHDKTIIDLSHESLIRQWQELKAWTEKEIKSAAIYRRLKQAALLNQDEECSLYRTPELENALDWEKNDRPTAVWAGRYGPHFELAMAFLRASERQQQAEQERKIRQARLKVRLTAGGLLLALGLMGWALLERNQRMVELFQSRLMDASLLARGEDYAQAKQVLAETDALDGRVEPAQRHARNLLRSFTEIKGGSAEQVYTGAEYTLYTVAISPDGQFLAAGGEHGSLVVFDVHSGMLLQRLCGHASEGPVRSVAFTPLGQLISAGDDKRIIFWQKPGGPAPAGEAQKPPNAQLSKPCPEAAAKVFQYREEIKTDDKVRAISVSPDGRRLASGGDDKTVILWDLTSHEKITTLPQKHNAPISKGGLAFSPDGRYLASASHDKMAIIWMLETGETMELKGHTDKIYSLSFSADGTRLATASADKTLRLWDTATGNPLRELNGHQQGVWAVSWFGDYLLSGANDRTIRVWDSRNGITLRVLQGHEAGLAAFALRAGQLWSASIDGTVRRWPLKLPFQQVLNLPEKAHSAAILPSLRHVAVGFGQGNRIKQRLAFRAVSAYRRRRSRPAGACS